jgi:hypothetical protein
MRLPSGSTPEVISSRANLTLPQEEFPLRLSLLVLLQSFGLSLVSQAAAASLLLLLLRVVTVPLVVILRLILLVTVPLVVILIVILLVLVDIMVV